jgi:hypothetical protein
VVNGHGSNGEAEYTYEMGLFDRLRVAREVVGGFADVAYQRRVWIEARGPEESSYSDDVVTLDDAEPHVLLSNWAEMGLDLRGADKFAEFVTLVDNFVKEYPLPTSDPEDVISAPGWSRIVQAASDLLPYLDEPPGRRPARYEIP